MAEPKLTRAQFNALSPEERLARKRAKQREANARHYAKLSPETKLAYSRRSNASRTPEQVVRRKAWHRWFGTARPAKKMFHHAKARAKKTGVPFGIRPEDVVIPPVCPVLGITLTRGNGKLHDGSPTLDRFIPEHGYVPGNVWVISHRANRIKNDATLQELEAVVRWMRYRSLI